MYSPARCNPHWGKAFVTVCQIRNWPDREHTNKGAPRTFSAGPGDPINRAKISLGESIFGTSALELSIRLSDKEEIRTTITIDQAHSIEEGLRAVFLAAREEGILPIRIGQ